MPLNNAMILWPIRFAATTYVLRATVASVSESLTFPSSGVLTVGRNYWLSGDGQADADGGLGGVGDLITMLATTLTSHSAPATFTGTLGATFRTFLQASTGSFTPEWNHAATTLDEAIFGFTNTTPLADVSQAGTLLPQGIWRPNRPVSFDSRERQPIVGGVARALSGLQRTSALALPLKERELGFSNLLQRYVLQEYEDTTEPFGSFEEAWINSMRSGIAWRYYPDETLHTTIAHYGLYRAASITDPMNRNEQYPIHWDVNIGGVRVA